MVLPSPAASNAVPSRRWLDRLNAVFHLAREQGVMVLVRGGPERFGDVVRRVVELAPDAEVLVRADAMASLEPGSTVVLYLRRQDFEWLNMARPVVRGHRVVLFGDPETALALEQSAFDFFDWISHRIEAPAGPPAFAVRSLRSAACARANVVVWKGGDLDATFAEALPGRALVRVSAAQPYADLVEAMRPKPKTWVAVTDLAEGFRVQRAQWAAAEAGRYGRTIWVEPATEPGSAWIAHAKPAGIEQAEEALVDAGLTRGARLAGLLDLEPEGIARAAMRAKVGNKDAEAEADVSGFRRPSAPWRDATSKRLPDWPERVDLALDHEDIEVAKRWAMNWQSITNRGPAATAALARIHAFQGLTDDAISLLHEAHAALQTDGRDEDRFRVWQAEAGIQVRLKNPAAAVRALKNALDLAMVLGKGLPVIRDIVLNRALALINLGRLEDAAKTLSKWASDPLRGTAPFPDGPDSIRTLASLNLAKGNADEAARWFEEALERLPKPDDRSRDVVAEGLAVTRLGQGRYAEAETLYQQLVERAKARGSDTRLLREGRADALTALGRYSEAELELREALEGADGEREIPIRTHLASCLLAQGRPGEAETLLDTVLATDEGRIPPSVLSLALTMKAHFEETHGDASQAVELRRRSIKAQEQAGLDATRIASSKLELARALLSLRRYSEAERLLKQVFAQAERRQDQLSATVALSSLAEAQAGQGFGHARDTARRALIAWSHLAQEPAPAMRGALERIVAARPAP